jgi:primosomal protein N' (replication factor Y) (superfamily II helicase)
MGGLFGNDPLEALGARNARRGKREHVAAKPTVRAPREPFTQRMLVAVERGVDAYPEGLTYGVPASLAPLRAGQRVIVPLGRGDAATHGWVVRVLETADSAGIPDERLKPVRSVDPTNALPAQVMELARWMSAYYACPLGVALAGVLPAAVKKGVGRVDRVFVAMSQAGRDVVAALQARTGAKRSRSVKAAAGAGTEPALPKLSAPQKRLLETLTDRADAEIESTDLLAAASVATKQPLKALIALGLVTTTTRTHVEADWLEQAARVGASAATLPTLTPDQTRVVGEIGATLAKGFSQHLLFGVTGSGKTEVYLRLMRQCLDAGRTALLLVPEISLTPQTAGRVLDRFPNERVAILHSALTAAQRNQQWMLVAEGKARVVVGARSAVFAPIPDGQLGLVLVDEEHDQSYKQDQAPRYHGRDLAIRRAQIAACPIVLGSATPSLESWFNAVERGTSALHRLPTRAPGLTTPKVEIIDFSADVRRFRDRRVHLLGERLAESLARVVSEDGQAILLLNRRGYANWISCSARCGWMMRCEHCDAGMVCHEGPRARFVRCHHCLTEQRLPEKCPDCAASVTVFGLGTQRVEEELVRVHPALAIPGAVLRVDGDTMRGSRDLHDALGRFATGEVRVLVGTQMIAKGLDFPNVRLVGVVNADTAINLPDFRASERTFQLVNQVAGRCGRGSSGGRAIVQTFQPDAAAIRMAAAHDFEGFAKQELETRKRFGLPPFKRMARVVVRHESETSARSIAQRIHDSIAALPETAECSVRGPHPCPVTRVADRFRMQVEILAPDAAALQRLITAARNAGAFPSGEVAAVDVDPVALL